MYFPGLFNPFHIYTTNWTVLCYCDPLDGPLISPHSISTPYFLLLLAFSNSPTFALKIDTAIATSYVVSRLFKRNQMPKSKPVPTSPPHYSYSSNKPKIYIPPRSYLHIIRFLNTNFAVSFAHFSPWGLLDVRYCAGVAYMCVYCCSLVLSSGQHPPGVVFAQSRRRWPRQKKKKQK